MRRLLLGVAVLLFVGCDGRQAFVGIFSGTQTLVVTNSRGERAMVTSTWSAEFTARDPNLLDVEIGGCTLTATVSGNAYEVRATTCPSTQVGFSDGSTCTQTITYTEGTGTVDGDALDADHAGQTVLSECSDGYTGTFTFTERISALRAD